MFEGDVLLMGRRAWAWAAAATLLRHRGPVIEVLRSQIRVVRLHTSTWDCAASSAEDGAGFCWLRNNDLVDAAAAAVAHLPASACSFDVLWEAVVGMYEQTLLQWLT